MLRKIKKIVKKMIFGKKKNTFVSIVCDETGWSYEEAKAKMDDFRKQGVNYSTYVQQKFYTMSPERIKRKLRWLEKKKNEYIDRVCEATGWDREHAVSEMDRVKSKYKLSYRKYCIYRFYSNTDEEIEERLRKYRETADRQIAYVVERSGWTKQQAKYHMKKVKSVFDIPFDYYCIYELWDCTDEEIATYARRKDSDRLFSKYNVKAETKVLQHKERFDEKYRDFVKRKFWTNKDTDYDEFLEFLDGLTYIFAKPSDLGGGQGTEKICVADHKPKDLYRYFMEKDKILVEECVMQHHEIDEFAPGCVNTIRVVTLLKDDECHFICAGIRFGNKGIVDNFHKDGMVCDIDIDTGTIVTPAIDRNGVTYTDHPVTGKHFEGFRIPNWDMVLELAGDAIRVQPGVNYVGWDIAVCEDKAVMIEGNSAPDLVLVQAPYAKQKKGMKYIFEKYF